MVHLTFVVPLSPVVHSSPFTFIVIITERKCQVGI